MKKLWGTSLSREITVVLVIKFTLILMIWLIFFRNPVKTGPRADDIGQALTGSDTALNVNNVKTKD